MTKCHLVIHAWHCIIASCVLKWRSSRWWHFKLGSNAVMRSHAHKFKSVISWSECTLISSVCIIHWEIILISVCDTGSHENRLCSGKKIWTCPQPMQNIKFWCKSKVVYTASSQMTPLSVDSSKLKISMVIFWPGRICKYFFLDGSVQDYISATLFYCSVRTCIKL